MQQRGAVRFALTRLLSAIPTLLFVILLAFLLMHAAPGGPFDDDRHPLSPEIEAQIREHYRLDQPLLVQFGHYLAGLLRGDLGPSYRYAGRDVAELIGPAVPVSFGLGGLAVLLALAIGIGAGVTAALYRNSSTDRLLSGLAMTGISVPVFVFAPILILVFAVNMSWLPASWTGGNQASRLLLPVIALALPQIAYITRLTRASMIEVLASDFVRTARAQGLDTLTVVFHHALKPAMLPLLSYMGPAIAAVMTGSVVVEQIFGVPGLGRLFVNASTNRDYTLVLGIVILYASLVILLNLLVDIFYGFVDPRIRNR